MGITDTLRDLIGKYSTLKDKENLGEEEIEEMIGLKKEITNILIELLNQVNNS